MKRFRGWSSPQAAGGLLARTLSGLKWALISEAAETLLALGAVMVLARLLAPAEFGQAAAAMIFVTLADTIVRQGLGPALVRHLAPSRRHLASGFALALGAGLALALALFAFAPWLARLAGAPDGAALLRALALITALTGLGVVSEHRLRRALRFRALAAASLIAKALGSCGLAVALALAGHGVWALVWGAVAHQAAFTFTVIALAPPRRLAAGSREAGELVHAGAGFSTLAFLSVVSGQTVNLIVARTLGAGALGLYTRAQSLAVLPARLGPILKNVLLPAMARRQRRPSRLRAGYLDATAMLSLAALPASAALSLGAPEIVAAVLGEQWEGAVPALRILALAGVLQVFNAMHVPVIRALGAVWPETFRRLAYFGLLAGGAWFGSRYGLAGLTGAVALAWAARHVLLAHLALGLLGLRASALLHCHLPGLWAAVWSAAGVLAAQALHADAWAAPAALALTAAAALSAAAFAVYFAPAFAAPCGALRGMERLPFERMGSPGRLARVALAHLGGRWPCPAEPP